MLRKRVNVHCTFQVVVNGKLNADLEYMLLIYMKELVHVEDGAYMHTLHVCRCSN